MKRVLVLGAGRVARPLARKLAGEVELTVASLFRSEAEALLAGGLPGTPLALDVRDEAALDRLVGGCDLAVSLLPAPEHPRVARACLAHRKHLVTSSYISPEMAALDGAARQAGVLFLNECGLDPGIDHMSALRLIDRARSAGGRVLAFRSCCGGLPAPEDNDNPIGYKVSWSPRGVLLAAGSPARYLSQGSVRDVPGPELFAESGVLEVEGVGPLEFYPNRDSIRYIAQYGLEGVQEMLRGTLRYPGHCATWFQWARMGLFDPEPREVAPGLTVSGYLADLVGARSARQAVSGRAAAAAALGLAPRHPALEKLAWLGLFDEAPLAPGPLAPLDLLAARLAERCAYRPGQRDLVVLVHEVVSVHPEGRKLLRSTLVEKGIPGGESAMARTVSLPVALAVTLILQGGYKASGVRAPLDPGLYRPLLAGLETLGLTCREQELPEPEAPGRGAPDPPRG